MRRSKINLPEDLIMEIFYLLPVISLLRIRSVCKLWLSIISDPVFISTHSNRSQIKSHKKASLLMLRNSKFNGQQRYVAFSDFNYYQLEISPFNVVGSCNGIICLEYYCNLVHLWNPATKQGKSFQIFPKIEEALIYFSPVSKQAFGFDTISKDYKILRFMFPTSRTKIVVPVMQLYSIGTGSLKVIHIHDTPLSTVKKFCDLELGPVINGVLYIGRKGNLVSFNLNNEMFSVVPYPCSLERYSNVLDFEGSPSLIFGEGLDVNLWTMKDNGGKVSWTKKLIVRNDLRWAYKYFGGGLLHGRSVDEESEGIIYAYIKKKFNLKKEFNLSVKNFFAVRKYTETLVSMEGFEPMPNGPLVPPRVGIP